MKEMALIGQITMELAFILGECLVQGKCNIK